MTEQKNPDQASDKGKTVVVDSTPPSSPIRTVRESGTPSSTITPEMWTVFDGMQAQITSLKDGLQSQMTELKDGVQAQITELQDGMQSEMAEIKADNKAKDEKMDQILSFLKELAERLPSKN
jgi:dGTP triphosphohydrolase